MSATLGKSQFRVYNGEMEAEIGARVREKLKVLQPSVTQAEMAVRLDLPPDAFSRSLSGKRAFTAVELVKLAEELKTSVHWFVTGEPDPLAVTFAGRHSYDPAVKDYVRVNWESSRQVRDDVALAYIQAYADEPPVVSTRSWTAQEARAALIDAGGANFVRQLANHVETAFGVGVVRVDGIEPDFALTVLGRHVIVLDASAYWFRENFSIAHELAHILLGHLSDLGEQACGNKAAERAANSFAAELLTPTADFSSLAWATMAPLDVASYVWAAGISTMAIRARLQALKIVTGIAAQTALDEKTQVLIQREIPTLADEVSLRMQEARGRRFPEQLVSAHSNLIAAGRLGAGTLAWMLGEPLELIRDELAPARRPADLDWLASELGLDE
ncbi:MAG: XRE family transcriptional regulator [Rhodoglobus sp.]